jgi:hypothetical protein
VEECKALIPGLFPASRLVGYLVRGLDSKNTKTRLEVLDVLAALMERHGGAAGTRQSTPLLYFATTRSDPLYHQYRH